MPPGYNSPVNERRGTYIHDTTIDVAKFLETEQPGAMGGVIEGEALNQLVSGVWQDGIPH